MNGQFLLFVCGLLFCIGMYGAVSKRDILRILIGVAIMLGSITLLAVLLAQPGTAGMGHAFVLFAWAIEVVEVIVALAIFIALARKGTFRIEGLEDMRW